jgi:hypothetical protein
VSTSNPTYCVYSSEVNAIQHCEFTEQNLCAEGDHFIAFVRLASSLAVLDHVQDITLDVAQNSRLPTAALVYHHYLQGLSFLARSVLKHL